jgi:hypothetical protein
MALRFVEEVRYWESVEDDDSPWEAAGSLLPVEGKARSSWRSSLGSGAAPARVAKHAR